MITTHPARHSDPDFVPSLRLLVERERYSLQDIGLMFGVSRERVRQWCHRYEIAHPDPAEQRGMMCVRVWDDASHRFQPVARGDITREKQRARGDAYRSRMRIRRSVRWQRAVAALVAQREQIGRADLSQREMAEAIFGRSFDDKQWGGRLQSVNRRLPLTETVRLLRYEAGLVDRDTRGEHLRGRRKTHCKRGHPLSGENLYVSRGHHYCRTCKREREHLRRRPHPQSRS